MKFIDKLKQWQALQGVGKKPSTVFYHVEIYKIILDNWPDGEQDVATITEEQMTGFVMAVARYSAPRLNAVIAAMKLITPAAKILKRRRVTIKERANITQKEFSALLNELDSNPRSHGGMIIRFLAQTGLRINEARQLRWCDVKADHLLCPGKITKSGKPRIIPFVPGVAKTLARLRSVSAEFVLPQSEVRRSLKTACAKVGIPPLSHHDFRHLFATRCVESAVDIPTAARWLGHQDGGALLGKLYFHLADAHSREMAGRVRI
jgi:integrase